MLQAQTFPVTERPNIFCETLGPEQFGIIEKPLTLFERIYNQTWLRKVGILVFLALGWEIYGRWLDNPLLVPPFSDAVHALLTDIGNGTIPQRAWNSIQVLMIGFASGTLLAGLLTVFAISSRLGTDFLDTMTAMFNPLPAIALLPLALIWFGDVGGLAQHARRLPRRVDDGAHGRAQLQSHRLALCRAHSDPCGLSQHSGGLEDRLGFRLAHLDRGRTGVRCVVGAGRSRLVHLREQEPAQHRRSLCRSAHHHHDRACG